LSRHRSAAIRIIARIVGPLFLWGPLAALALMGVGYVQGCLEFLSAPGMAVRLPIEGRSGFLEIRAQSYTFNVADLRLAAEGVSIYDPQARLLGTAESVAVRLPDLIGGDRKLIDVRIIHLEADLERGPDGKLTLLALLPERKEEPSEQAYAVRIEQARIRLVDRVGGANWVRAVEIPMAQVDGFGSSWRAFGRLSHGGGSVAFESRMEPKSGVFALRADTNRFDLAPWMPALRRTPEAKSWEWLKTVDARSFRSTGAFELRIPKKGEPTFYGSSEVEALQFEWDGIRAASLSARAEFDLESATGRIWAQGPGTQARFDGRVGWKSGLTAFGSLEADAEIGPALPKPLRLQLPKELNFRKAAFRGDLRFDPKSGPSAQGRLTAEKVAWRNQIFENVSGLGSGDYRNVSLRKVAGRYLGVAISGAGDIDLKQKRLRLSAKSEPMLIERFQKELGTDRIRGMAELTAVAEGPIDRPKFELRAKGHAFAEIQPGNVVDVGDFSGLAHLEEDQLRVTRFDLAGEAGVVSASGSYHLSSRALDLGVVGSGIDLALLDARFAGTATGRLTVTGTPREPRLVGPVEVYGLKYNEQTIPLAGAELEADAKQLMLRNLVASRGSATAAGEMSWTYDSGALSGRFSANSVQLHDWFGDAVQGGIEVTEGRIAGSLENPEVTAELRGRGLLVQGIRIDAIEGSASWRNPSFDFRGLRATIGVGTLEAEGNYDLEARSGQFTASARELPFEAAHALLPPETSLGGSATFRGRAFIENAALKALKIEGSIGDLEINGAYFGSGTFSTDASDDLWKGQIDIGQPERFLQLEDFSYNTSTEQIEGSVECYSLPIRDLFRAMRPFVSGGPESPETGPTLSPSVQQLLERVEGAVDTKIGLGGRLTNPDLVIGSLLIRDLEVDGEAAGAISAQASRKSEQWKVDALQWKGGPGTLDVNGVIVENGTVSLDGNLYNLDTQWLSRFLPALAKVSGEATLFFTVSGQTRNPQIEASLAGSLFEAGLAAGERNRDKELKLEVYPILVSDGEISLSGLFNYRGFSGDLKGSIPFRYPFEFPSDKEVAISLHVPNRPLESLTDLMPKLDRARTKGSVWADVNVSGRPGAIHFDGAVHLDADRFAFKDVDTALTDLTSLASFREGEVRFTANAKSEKGGSVTAKASLQLQSIGEVFGSNLSDMLANRVDGTLRLNQFRVEEKELPLDAKKQSLASFSVGAVNGGVRITGSLREPLLSTFVPLALERVSGEIPSLLLESTESTPPPIAPRFNIAYVVGTRREPAEVRAAASTLNLFGAGTLKGRLDDLEANANLTLRSGHLRLPNARINLIEGGTVKLRYDSGAFDSNLRLDVDLEGRTALSTLRFGTLIERYDIFLELRGNLLNSEEQVIQARSDPPDLSQERILNLLGQIELVEQLAGQQSGSAERRRFQQALGTIAIPVLFDPVTESLARQIGLEYLSLEYGPLGQTSAIAAKWLGKGFTLQGLREISEPIDGVPDYDLRLTYRPPRRIRTLRGLTFSVGIDQDRPWKISVEYGQRFGASTSNRPSTPIKIG